MLAAVESLLPIGEFAQRSGLSPKRLRSYAANGLLVPAVIDSVSGYRFYTPGQLADAGLIAALRAARMPLEHIARVLRSPDGDNLLDVWARHLEDDTANRRAALEAARALLTTPHSVSKEPFPMIVNAASASDIGRIRGANQDRSLVSQHLVAVADGMGATPAGEVAASLALAVVEAGFTGNSLDELQASVRAANRAITERAQADAGLTGMGTTVCAAGVTADGGLAVVHVGDSRAYLLRDEQLQVLTGDHTVTGELVRQGKLTDDEARHHPQRSMLTKALGAAADVDVDSVLIDARPGDRILVCTDGLFNELRDNEIGVVLTSSSEPEAAAADLVARAVSSGGRDNIAVVVADLERKHRHASSPPTVRVGALSAAATESASPGVVLLCLLVLVVVAGVVGYLFSTERSLEWLQRRRERPRRRR